MTELVATPRVDAAVVLEDVPEGFRRAEDLLRGRCVNLPGCGDGGNDINTRFGRQIIEGSIRIKVEEVSNRTDIRRGP